MRRFYEKTSRALVLPERVLEGVHPQDPVVGYLWSGIIAFDAPRGRNLGKYLQRNCEGFLFVCVPGRELVTARMDSPGFAGIPCGLKALPLLAWMIMELVNSSPRPIFLRPDYTRYRDQMVKALGNMEAWTMGAATPDPSKREAEDA